MIPADIHFSNPLGALLLLAIPLFLFWKKKKLTMKHSPIYFGHSLCFIVGWVFLTIALMSPEGNGRYLGDETVAKHRKVALVLDASASMLVSDMRQSRFDTAKEIMKLVATGLQGERISLYAFTGNLIPLAPETYDTTFINLMIDQAQIEGGGTDFAKSLKELGQDQVVVLFSDGGDLAWEKEKNTKKIKDVTSKLSIIAVGVGSQEGGLVPNVGVKSVLHDDLLKEISEGYFYAGSETSFSLAQDIILDVKETPARIISLPTMVYDQYFQLPLFLAILFFVLSLSLPKTSSILFLMVFGKGFCLEPWQQEIERVNTSTTFVNQGQWHRARKWMSELDENNFSLLMQAQYALNNSIVLAHLNQFSGAQKNLDIALKNYCELKKRQGFKVCPTWMAAENAVKDIQHQRVNFYMSMENNISDTSDRARAKRLLIQALQKPGTPNKLELQTLLHRLEDQEIQYPEDPLQRIIAKAVRSAEKAVELNESVSQKDAMEAAAPFPQAVLTWQQETNECHEHPWDKVFPSFFKGLNHSEQALQLLENNQLPLALTHQEKMLKAWKKALEYMQEGAGGKKFVEEKALLKQVSEMHLQDTTTKPRPRKVDRLW